MITLAVVSRAQRIYLVFVEAVQLSWSCPTWNWFELPGCRKSLTKCLCLCYCSNEKQDAQKIIIILEVNSCSDLSNLQLYLCGVSG